MLLYLFGYFTNLKFYVLIKPGVEIKPGPELSLRGNFRRLCSQVKLYFIVYATFCRPPVKTFKIKYFVAFGLKILSKWREKWDESTGIRPKKRKPMIPKLSRIKRTAFFIIWAICQQIIQFRLAFKDKAEAINR
jgi:hypothetical protein